MKVMSRLNRSALIVAIVGAFGVLASAQENSPQAVRKAVR
jgi:hypothetical protein